MIGDGAGEQDGDMEEAQVRRIEQEMVVFSNHKSLYLIYLPMLHSFSSRAVAFQHLAYVNYLPLPTTG